RKARAEATSVLQLREDEETLRQQGADEAEVHRFREGTLGADAADRLDQLDRDRAAWEGRVEGFRGERGARCGDGAGRAACETELLQASFDAREQLRVRVILGLN